MAFSFARQEKNEKYQPVNILVSIQLKIVKKKWIHDVFDALCFEENHWMVVSRCLAIVQYSIRQSDFVKCAMTYSQSDPIQHDPHFSQLICFLMKAFILNTIFAIGLELIPFLNFTIDCVPLRHTNKPIKFF